MERSKLEIAGKQGPGRSRYMGLPGRGCWSDYILGNEKAERRGLEDRSGKYGVGVHVWGCWIHDIQAWNKGRALVG